MIKIDYQNKKLDFYKISSFARANKLDHINALDQAFEQNVLIEDNKDLLSNFINSIRNKEDIKSQLYQDMFASFIIGDRTVDIKTGENAKIKTVLVKTGYAGNDRKFNCNPDYTFLNFNEAISQIIN